MQNVSEEFVESPAGLDDPAGQDAQFPPETRWFTLQITVVVQFVSGPGTENPGRCLCVPEGHATHELLETYWSLGQLHVVLPAPMT